jgi:hypothetical protein
MKWSAFGGGVIFGAVVAAVALAASGDVSAKIAGGGVQLLGTALALLGVAVVRASFELAADKAVEAKLGLDRWWGLRRERLRNWWAHRRGRPAVTHRVAFDAATVSEATLVTTVQRYRVDRQTVSDRDWLVHLDDRLYSLHDVVDRAEESRIADRDEVLGRLGAQREELRAEIQRETRQGWQLIVAGLACSAVGTAVGMAG